MQTLVKVVLFLGCLALFFPPCLSQGQTRPPRPGPNFSWTEPHRAPDGTTIPGHWEYKGPLTPGKTWVPGHYGSDGSWREGKWQMVKPPRPGAMWIPGRYGPRGRWIPGHWQ